MDNEDKFDDFAAILAAFDDSVKWLLSFIQDPTGARYLEDKERDVRLQELREQVPRTADFLDFAGNPEAAFASVHVAGTSGKGSIVTMIAALLTQCGQRTGYHVSPYLQVCNEKLIIDDQMISPSAFIALVDEFKAIYEAWVAADRSFDFLKYGEVWVALTYLCFAKHPVNWAVIETGVGGRYDPTNAISSQLAIVNNIELDHTGILGETREEIAFHKAGIIKESGLVVVGNVSDPVALRVIEEEVAQKGATAFYLGKDFDYEVHELGGFGSRFTVRTPLGRYKNLTLAMQGSYQPENAALAVTAVDLLAQKFNFPISQERIQAALGGITYPGRMEIIQNEPLVILDGAHNPHKMQALVDSLRAIYPGKKITAVVGMLAMKEVTSMLAVLAPLVDRFVVTKPHVYGKPSLPPVEIGKMIDGLDTAVPYHLTENIQEALDLALPTIQKDEMLLVTGSLYLLGEAKNYWEKPADLLRRIEREYAW